MTVRFVLEFVAVLLHVQEATSRNSIKWHIRTLRAVLRNKPPEGLGSDAASLESAIAAARCERSEASYARVVRVALNRAHTLRAITATLPLVGFLGTVAGLSNSLIGASGVSSESAAQRQTALQSMEIALGTAFDKSMLAFAAAIVCTLAERWICWRINRIPEALRDEVGEVTLQRVEDLPPMKSIV